MSKAFREAFPTLKLEEELEGLLDTTEVTKISANHEHTHIRIYLRAKRLIFKKNIWKLEKAITEQIFQNRAIQVKIIESYELSEQYTPKSLIEVYKDSILDELNAYSVLEYNLLRTADMEFPEEDRLILTMDETIIAKTRTDEIIEFLEKVICERCGMNLKIFPQYRKPQESKYRKNSEEQIRQEVAGIVARTKLVMEGKSQETEEKEKTVETEEKTKTIAKTAGNRADASKNGTNYAKPKQKFEKRGEFRRKFESDNGKKSMNPDVIYGRDFEEESMEIEKIDGPIGEVVIRGKILSVDTREIRNEKTIIIFSVTDFTDTIVLKIFARNDDVPELLKEISGGKFVRVKGVATIDKFDSELTIGSIVGIKKCADFTTVRMDTSVEKRIELHCHTKMSDMDGVSEAKDIVKRAHDWGHPAIAITDHGVAQAFPDANHYIETLDKDDPFKVLYGVEGYVVDDLTEIAVNAGNQTLDDTYIVFDIETTGFSSIKDAIIEVGAVKVTDGKITDRFSTFVNPKRPIPFEITNLTSITDEMVMDSPTIDVVLPQFLEFAGDGVLVAHNAGFDVGFIEQNCRSLGLSDEFVYLDTVALARVLLPTLSKYKLNIVAKALNISLENHHRAVDDAEATAEIFVKFTEMLKKDQVGTLKEVNRYGDRNVNAIRKMPTHHIIILAKNDIGRYNLYQLISQSHMTYYARRPRIPKSLLNEHREGLLIGSACEAGELHQAVHEKRSAQQIARLAEFYDYYEIQPVGNNQFMIESERIADVNSIEDLQNINREIVELGEKFGKPVVATCDVHFLNPDDEVYRRIIMAGKGFDDADRQPPLFLRTTDEMLEEFSYLGAAKAREIVIDNPVKIAGMIEKISPVNPNKCPPVIENSDQELRDICYRKAHEMYGEDLPKQVSARLEKELNSIISNGYAVMYIIAQKLVWKSNADGYLVGSRGSVGSSFVATMAGITEVNPLSPHYYCSKCHYSDFESDEVRSFAGGCGYDMPDKKCPVCGEQLVKAGFDIPFETFLGFKGDKEPDIDLNFSGDYQAKAHKYTEVLFGEGHTFKAGTIGTLADKTAYGFVRNYYEEHEQRKRKCEIERVTEGCTGIRRSTGQHPGGIVVLPHGHDINEFTPVQHPANDMECGITTTHFDYHSIDHNLLKLDILGHDDPTMIRTLEDYITSDAMENEYNADHPFIATEIPLDDKDVIELFHGTEVLGIKPEDIDGCKIGSLGIPEFGTDFVIQMVQDTKPQTLSDLIRISGLSHGTNVWLGNAQELVKSGKATISTAICTRDDIMIYLINKGVESALAFTIMESVRKGKGLKPEWEEAMKAQDVPDWYIWSCKKISYMFPKAHAAAYVMMAYRIAYCKINYPLAYYAAYFGIRADAFSYALMCQGKETLNYHIKQYKSKGDQLSKKEQDVLKDMKIVQEMYARGFEFVPIDIYRAKAKMFQIVDGKLMPSLASIEGMGDKAAEAVEEAAKDGAYLSLDDFRQRTKVSKTVIDLMAELGLFGDLPQSNQLSLFDFT
mgnify:CR=1 FL=1